MNISTATGHIFSHTLPPNICSALWFSSDGVYMYIYLSIYIYVAPSHHTHICLPMCICIFASQYIIICVPVADVVEELVKNITTQDHGFDTRGTHADEKSISAL